MLSQPTEQKQKQLYFQIENNSIEQNNSNSLENITNKEISEIQKRFMYDIKNLRFPITITNDMVDKFLDVNTSQIPTHMYL